jgi:glycosyltransferase involved in cell wall biosynthesis
MRVLMFGWEFPPQFSGGLGVACEGLVRGLLAEDAEVVLVLPRYPHRKASGKLRLLESLADPPRPAAAPRSAAAPAPEREGRRLVVRRVVSRLRPYPDAGVDRREESVAGEAPSSAAAAPGETATALLYGPNLATDVLRYAERAGAIARRERFDVIHSHDWMTFLAGLEARRVSGKPLVVHVHATEFDRSGGAGNPFVREIERAGLAGADRVIAVSRYTASLVTREYGVAAERIRVVHNAIDPSPRPWTGGIPRGQPLVLFAGRVTWQKGPDYFIEAAARVAREVPDVLFAVAGSGDRLSRMRERVRALGLTRRIFFTGFLAPDELARLYARADVYVLPSFSEPFGLTALEAMQHGTPVIVSRSAGVSEVVRHVLTVDFGRVDDLASRILSVLRFRPLARSLSRRGQREVARLSWRESAGRVLAVYREVAGGAARRTAARRRAAR